MHLTRWPLHALAGLSRHLLPLQGAGPLPLLVQVLALLWWQLLEAAKVLSHGVLLARGQRPEALPAIAQHAALLGWQGTPGVVALARVLLLLLVHLQPALAAERQALLPLRREAAPLGSQVRKQPLLLLGQAAPGHTSGGAGRGARHRSARKRRRRLGERRPCSCQEQRQKQG
jgi:hypothetical protein